MARLQRASQQPMEDSQPMTKMTLGEIRATVRHFASVFREGAPLIIKGSVAGTVLCYGIILTGHAMLDPAPSFGWQYAVAPPPVGAAFIHFLGGIAGILSGVVGVVYALRRMMRARQKPRREIDG